MNRRIIFLCIFLFQSVKSEFGCRDENNNLVDWFYLYKLPENTTKSHHHHPDFDGFQYAFVTPSSIKENEQWIISNRTINHPQSIPGLTLAPMYSTRNKDILSLMYNDEPPHDKMDETRGHTKGVVAVNDKEGFWLVHSVPHFPPEANSTGYDYPSTGRMYGQSYLCISLNASELEKVGKQLIFNEPNIYSSNIPVNLKQKFPNLVQAAEMQLVETPPFWSQQTIASKKGVKFQSFAKSRKFNKELYKDWIAPTLATDLYAETWEHGAGNLPSDCKQIDSVYNIKNITVDNEYQFSTLKDHSKWAVSPVEKDWICVGDINRQEHQKERGGGSVCQSSQQISRIYRNTITNFEPCRFYFV